MKPLLTAFSVVVASLALIGPSRAADAVVNVLLPLAAALGALSDDPALVRAAEAAYAAHPPLAENWITRLVRELWDYLGYHNIAGLFSGMNIYANDVAAIPSLHAAYPVMIAMFFWENLRRERITDDELAEEMRLQQIGSLEEVGWAILESNG